MSEPSIRQAKILLYGLAGAGKSFSVSTLFKLQDLRPHQRVIYLCTERNALDGLKRGLDHYKIQLKPNQLIYWLASPKKKKAFGNEVRALSNYVKPPVAAQKTDRPNLNKDKYTFFIDIIRGLEDFKGVDYITGKEVAVGNIGELEYEDILVVDGLSPITHAIWQITKGDRVGGQVNDYQVVQYWIKQFTQDLIALDCSVIMLAHADRSYDDIEKVEKLRISLEAGVALAGKYAGGWGDVIYAYNHAARGRLWAGKKVGVEVVARNFPERDLLEPDFSKYGFFREDGEV